MIVVGLVVIWLALASTASAAQLEPTVIGGQTATEQSDSPFVRLQLSNNAVCSGTFVDSRHVVSAAHCFFDSQDRRLGATLWWGSNYYHSQQRVALADEAIVTHPRFRRDNSGFYNDLAVIKLKEPLAVQPLLPQMRNNRRQAAPATVFGWGVTEKWQYSDRLLTADFNIWSKARCEKFIRSYGGRRSLVNNWLCAGYLNGGQLSGARSICWGDSGGPLIEAGRLVGVLSWIWPSQEVGAAQCLNSPAMYTRFDRARYRWLQKQLAD